MSDKKQQRYEVSLPEIWFNLEGRSDVYVGESVFVTSRYMDGHISLRIIHYFKQDKYVVTGLAQHHAGQSLNGMPVVRYIDPRKFIIVDEYGELVPVVYAFDEDSINAINPFEYDPSVVLMDGD